VSDNPTDTYTVSFKSDEGYGAALLVVRGDNVAELEGNLEAVKESLLETIVETKGLFHAAAGVAAPAPAAAPQQQAAAPAQQQSAPAGEDKFCNHGKRQYKSGTNSRGKWEGWMCPQPKNASDKCEPVWG
jgi:hypothetical protein